LAAPPYTQLGPRGEIVVHPAQAVADRLIIIMDQTVSAQQVVPLAAAAGARVRTLLPRSRMMVVDLPAGSDLATAAAQWRLRPGVRLAVPDTYVYPQLIPNDPQYPKQYHLPLIHAPQAWDVTTGSSSVIIAVVDSGVDLNHPDLAAKIWTNPREIAGNGRDDDGNGYVDDVHGWNFVENNNNVEPVPVAGEDNSVVAHGTLAAGIAAAVSNEGWGSAGVDWQARIMPLKIFAHDGTGTVSGVVQAIEYAVANGAKVINLSLGGSWSDAFTPAIQAAYQAGVVVVCAAGNQNLPLGNSQATWESPVCNDGPNPLTDNMILGVGATDANDRKAYYSNYDTSTGKHFVDLSAPGDEIYGPLFYAPSFPDFGQYWGTNSGTSFSCPQAAGAAALLLAHEPTLTPAQVFARLKAGTDNIDSLNPGYAGMLGGRLNIARSLGLVSPPQAAHNVQAADTVGDEGGSITITWLKSGDDGAGANNVTKYTIRRRTGATGAFASLHDVAKGAEQYVDNTTTDGTDYYYQVRTWAGTLYSDSDIAGPAQSRNDNPPMAVTTLTAADRSGDSGGAIVLQWTYSAPPDFKEFHLYRQPYNFTNVTGRTPVAVITNSLQTTYTDTTVTDGTDYYYALTAVDSFGNENKNVSAVGPVQSFPNQNISFNAGVQLMATPVLPADLHPATLLGLATSELVYARYNAATQKYVVYAGEPLSPALRLALGQGFWVNLPRPVTVSPTGQSAPAGDFPVSLVSGWQALGNPFFGAVDFAACTVTSGGTTMDLASAEQAGLVHSQAWLWDAALAGYRMINGDTGGSRLISPWQGFWVHAIKPCTLNVTRPGAASVTSVRPQASGQAAAGEWRLQLTAQAGRYQDPDNYLGVAAQAREVESPPLPGEGVDLALGAAPDGGPVAVRLLAASTQPLTQPLTVTWAGVTGPIRLSWPTVNTLSGDKVFLLTDVATGQVTNLRASPSYLFQATQPSGQRSFTLSVTDRIAGSLQVTVMSAQSTGQGAQITFALSAPATCDVEILNIAGRSVRQVLTGAVRPAGANVVLWDGRNQGGARVPSGQYLVNLQARDEQGALVRLVRSLVLTAR
jgi:subtilisin family serine protease